MKTTFKKYYYSCTYRGYQVTKFCTAKSYKEASEKLDVEYNYFRKYASFNTSNDPINGVMSYIDSGYIIFDKGRRDLSRKEMPWDELRPIIDFYVNEKYGK
jgi:hypothetical protein